MNQVGRAYRAQLVSSILKALRGTRFRKLLARKGKHNVSSFVVERHAIGKGVLYRDPAHIDAERFIGPLACNIELFVTEDSNYIHTLKLLLFTRLWYL